METLGDITFDTLPINAGERAMTLVSHWTEIAMALDLEIQSPVSVTLPDGGVVNAPLLLKNFGYENGMILFEGIPSDVRKISEALVALGYGFSCLGEYQGDEVVDLDAAKEVLADWGWSGPADRRPDWLADPPGDDDDL